MYSKAVFTKTLATEYWSNWTHIESNWLLFSWN